MDRKTKILVDDIMMIDMENILLIEAHPDDFLIGASGTISRLRRENPNCNIWSIYFSPCNEDSNNIGNLKEHKKSCDILGVDHIICNNFPRNLLENRKNEIRDILYSVKEKYNPDMVITHSKNDWHNDHVAVAEASLNAFRNSALCLCYESPSVSPSFTPNMYISLTQEDVDSKLKALNCWESQKRCRPYFFSIDRFKAKLISRGTEVRESYSEAFEVIGKI